MATAGKAKLRAGEDDFPHLPGGDALAQSSRAVLKSKYLGYAQEDFSGMCGLHHLTAFLSIHCHWFLTEHRLPETDGQ